MVDVVEEVVGFSVVERSLETVKKYFERRPNDALSHIRSIQGLQKEVSSIIWKFSSYYYRLFRSVSLVGRISSSYDYINYFFQLV